MAKLIIMEIKFRGWRTDGKGWVYGDLLTVSATNPRIIPFDMFLLTDFTSQTKKHEVTPESVGQYTGRQNIFKDDIVDVEDGADGLPEEMKVF